MYVLIFSTSFVWNISHSKKNERDMITNVCRSSCKLDSSWNVMAHGDEREEKWRGNWRMEWVDSTPHTTSEHGVSNITNADVQISAASSRLNWSPRRFKWTRSFRRKTKYGFCACAITFQLASTTALPSTHIRHLLRMYSLDSFHLLRFALWEIPDSSKFLGTAVAQWLRCCATNRKVAG